jgi:hypothetical protein
MRSVGANSPSCTTRPNAGQRVRHPPEVADIYGSAWITNGTGSIILLSGEPGDPIVGFRHVRTPANEIGPLQLLHEQSTGTLTVHHSTDLVAGGRQRRQRAVGEGRGRRYVLQCQAHRGTGGEGAAETGEAGRRRAAADG